LRVTQLNGPKATGDHHREQCHAWKAWGGSGALRRCAAARLEIQGVRRAAVQADEQLSCAGGITSTPTPQQTATPLVMGSGTHTWAGCLTPAWPTPGRCTDSGHGSWTRACLDHASVESPRLHCRGCVLYGILTLCRVVLSPCNRRDPSTGAMKDSLAAPWFYQGGH